MAAPVPVVQQISLSLSIEKNAVASATSASASRLERDLTTIRAYIDPIAAPAELPVPIHRRLPPFNICITRPFASKVEAIHRLLDRALVDIVERWYTDTRADFPSRMPLEAHEEDLLRWISLQSSAEDPKKRAIPRFGDRYGMWRTDFLIEKGADAGAKICEINARIPYNGFYVTGLHEESTRLLGGGKLGFEIPNDYETTKKTVRACFDESKPLYHIRKLWPGVDSRIFARDFEQATGQDVIHVEPAALMVEEDENSTTGWTVYFKPEGGDNRRHKIEQCTIELFQEELCDIDPRILRQLATCCVNDFRNILLLHDKRLLGIVQQELPSLVERKVLDSTDAEILRNGIAETYSPGSEEMRSLFEASSHDPLQRHKYIIKPVRSASGKGIQLGSQISQEEWVSLLERSANRPLRPNEDAYVVQKLVDHLWCDIVRHEVQQSPEGEQFHLIGSCHMVNSQLFVFGPWRIGHTVHVGIAEGSHGIVMSSVLRPDNLETIDGRKEE